MWKDRLRAILKSRYDHGLVELGWGLFAGLFALVLAASLTRNLLNQPSLKQVNADQLAMSHWPSAAGKVDEVVITDHIYWTFADDRPNTTAYDVAVTYSYDVAGKKFKGTKERSCAFKGDIRPALAEWHVELPENSRDETPFLSLARKEVHPSGRPITVYYDPNDPAVSVLDQEPRFVAPVEHGVERALQALAALVLAVIGLLFFKGCASKMLRLLGVCVPGWLDVDAVVWMPRLLAFCFFFLVFAVAWVNRLK